MAKQGLKIGELSRISGTSISTIHYYVKEGLLVAPSKTSRNMAYYDPAAVEEIAVIRELQSKKFMPLSAIKLIIEARRHGQSPDHISEMSSFLTGIFGPLPGQAQPQKLTPAQLASASGLLAPAIKKLESAGFIAPEKTEHGTYYDELDLRIAGIYKRLGTIGISIEDLDIYREYIKFIKIEAKSMHSVFHRLPDHEKIPITEIFRLAAELKEILAFKVYRREVGHPEQIKEKPR